MQKNKVHKMETGKFSLRKIIDNNLFFLKLIHKASPWFLSSSVVITAVEACVEFVSDTFMLRFALNGINVGRPFRSHRLSTTRYADRIYMFDSGKLVECGTHEELTAAGGRYAYMFRLQAEKYRE